MKDSYTINEILGAMEEIRNIREKKMIVLIKKNYQKMRTRIFL